MKYKLQVYSIWEYGSRKDSQGNPHQEDSLYPLFGQECPEDRTFILCDGMGGHGSGEVASAAVCEAMSKSIINDGHDPEGEFDDEDLAAAITAAYALLDEKDTHEAKKMGTTMTFLKLHINGATIAHIGDSRVYQIRPGKNAEDTKILFQTRDHSLVNDLVKIGELTPEQARHSPQKNVITRSMMPGAENRHCADVWHTRDIKPGDYFYMCSDGMIEQDDMESGEQLRAIFSAQGGTDAERVRTLRDATEHNRDNHTAFIIHILAVEDPLPTEVAEAPRMLEIEQASATGELPPATNLTEIEPMVEVDTPAAVDTRAPGMRGVSPYTPNPADKRKIANQKQALQKYRRIIIFLIIVIVAVIGLSLYFILGNDSSNEREAIKETTEETGKPDKDTVQTKLNIVNPEVKDSEKEELKKPKDPVNEEIQPEDVIDEVTGVLSNDNDRSNENGATSSQSEPKQDKKDKKEGRKINTSFSNPYPKRGQNSYGR
ncbi:MAG: protein phosphatase 2C domain-containing protein [Muribaculaceae bacterium]|nr:protein phosphatase 2C domain-containing protein [Muribaculaceae bacterium]